MSVDFLSAARVATYNALNGNLGGVPVYDHVPYQPEGQPDVNFPCVVIGEASESPWDTDDTQGADITHRIHCWSSYKGTKEINELQSLVKSLLNRQSLTAAGCNFVDVLHEFSDVTPLSDGITRMGTVQIKFTIQEI